MPCINPRCIWRTYCLPVSTTHFCFRPVLQICARSINFNCFQTLAACNIKRLGRAPIEWQLGGGGGPPTLFISTCRSVPALRLTFSSPPHPRAACSLQGTQYSLNTLLHCRASDHHRRTALEPVELNLTPRTPDGLVDPLPSVSVPAQRDYA